MFDTKKLSSDFNKSILEMDSFDVIKDVHKSRVREPHIKYGLFLTTSALKTKLLSKEILSLTKENRFFPAIATLRMFFEELILVIFVLSRMEKQTSWNSADGFLTKLNIGRMTGRNKNVPAELLPFRIGKALKETEKYVGKNFPKFPGKFRKIYTFISDYVHPNAPTRYHFWKVTEDKLNLVYHDRVGEQDLGMVLNYAVMILKFYKIIWKRLHAVSLPFR